MSGYPDSIFAAILRSIHAPITACTLHLCRAWQAMEGAHADHNPWDTEYRLEPCTDYNDVGVKNYGDEATGVRATVLTLTNGRYPHIIDALQNQDAKAFGLAVDASPWGTHGVAEYLRENPAPAPSDPANDGEDTVMTKLPTLAEGAGMPPRNPNPHVRNVQALLVCHHVAVDVDGRYGHRTASAVATFQRDHGLAADGKTGARTWERLLDV